MNNQDQNRRLTKEDFQGWPHLARVAFAARCARRIQPIFLAAWPDAPAIHTEALETAITLGEELAAGARAADSAKAYAYANAAVNAANAAYANAAADAYANAANAANAAANAAAAHAHANAANAATNAANAYAKAAADITTDHTKLKQAIDRRDIDHDTPVPPSFFGPMWPDGVPDGWPDVDPVTGKRIEANQIDSSAVEASEVSVESGPESALSPKDVVFELDLPADATDEQVKEAVVELTKHLNRVHTAHGGGGLVLSEVQVFDPVMQEVPS